MKTISFLPLATIFITVLLAELGDKSQLATVFLASDDTHNPYLVFVVVSLALIVATAIAVLVGNLASRYMAFIPLQLLAGIGFVAIGLWIIVEYVKG